MFAIRNLKPYWSRTGRLAGVSLLACASALVVTSARASMAPQVPSVNIAASTMIVMNCETEGVQTPSRIQLTATPRGYSTTSLNYRWTVSGGRLAGTGAKTTWDLTGARPGPYRAVVEVTSGNELDCLAFSSLTVLVRECPPPSCPNITMYCPEAVTAGDQVTFNANVTGIPASIRPVYTWRVSSGRIVSGQGTTTLVVDTTGLEGQTVRASLDVAGFNLDCSAACSIQIPIKIQPRRFDEFPEIARDDEKARLDNFAIQLQNEPDSRAYLVIYPSSKMKQGEAQKRAARLRDYLVDTRGLDSSRITTVYGTPQPEIDIELWLVPAGASPPIPR